MRVFELPKEKVEGMITQLSVSCQWLKVISVTVLGTDYLALCNALCGILLIQLQPNLRYVPIERPGMRLCYG